MRMIVLVFTLFADSLFPGVFRSFLILCRNLLVSRHVQGCIQRKGWTKFMKDVRSCGEVQTIDWDILTDIRPKVGEDYVRPRSCKHRSN